MVVNDPHKYEQELLLARKMRTHRSGPSGKCKLHWNEAEIWRQADSRKNEFLATFAHELRNLSRQ
jgi:hypothetical protein